MSQKVKEDCFHESCQDLLLKVSWQPDCGSSKPLNLVYLARMQSCGLPDSCGICGILPNYLPLHGLCEARGVVPPSVRKTSAALAHVATPGDSVGVAPGLAPTLRHV